MPRLFDTHEDLLSKAVAAAHERTYWLAFPEVPNGKIYGESAKAAGAAALSGAAGAAFVAKRFRIAALRRPQAA